MIRAIHYLLIPIGKPLFGQFKGLHELRVDDYQVIYSRTREGVLILRIGHRSTVYERWDCL